ncbi:xanthine dehydrogenase family protein molybdopterin-binding subunit [Pseudomonas amygdali]|uniref:xanthine dehydrogenase family protein molybdopterin-binding subunit n=1 Tax=Pseudomonas amygdali TaxID=47877 RepID=UPI0005C8BE88|nr:xanthine dehydrogenase family protein molybdopterin-binding subunit [Pseudomonas amygdali]
MSEQTIGTPQRRIDGRKKVTGNALYAADHPVEGLLFAYGVYSTIANGRIRTIHDQDAARMPGVMAVLHHENVTNLHRIPKVLFTMDPAKICYQDERRMPFEDDKVNYPGQFVALVVAKTFEQARAAAYRVKVDYDTRDTVSTLEKALGAAEPKNSSQGHSRGDAVGAFGSGVHRIDITYTTPNETHSPMEMHATTAYWQNGRLYVYESTQGVVNHRNVLANVFDLSIDKVEVNAPFIGSGFGAKLFPWPHSIAACAASRQLGRPVQLVVPRAQVFTTVGHRPETKQQLRLATNAQGKLVSIRHETVNTTSMTDDYIENCGGVTKSLYSCANVMTSEKSIQVNRGTPTSMRAPGAAPGLFALESAIDEMALSIGQDPLAFRQMNLATKDESSNLPWSSNHLPEALTLGAERFGWHQRNAAVGSMRDGDEIIGYGMGACNWEAFRLPADARVILKADGTALVQCAVQDIGTGTYTIVAQTVADITGLPIDRIQVELGSSAFPTGPLSGGSWVTVSVMPAVAEASREALRTLRRYAVNPNGPFKNLAPESLRSRNGRLESDEKSVSYAEVLKSQRLSKAEGEYHSPGADSTKFSFRSFGAHFVEVRWDPGISRLRVARVVSAIDVGKVINPLAAKNQVEGAIVMGIGMSLFENAEFDARNGLPVNNNFAEYVVPVHADQPDIDVILLDYPDLHLSEFGGRGIGEIGITGLAAAVANAVYHATGKRIRNLPITLDKLMDTVAT